MRVSIVSPFYNEELILAESVRRMLPILQQHFGKDWELILVDDGSTDNSLKVLKSTLGKRPPRNIHILSYSPNQGRGHALKAGIDQAKGDYIVTTEIDGSWGHDIAIRLIQAIESKPGLDFVIASPHLKGGALVNVNASRRFLTIFGNYLIRLFFELNITMNTGMTRCYRREVIQPLLVHSRGKEFHLEVLLKLVTLGFRYTEIPATLAWTEERSHKKPSRKSSTKILDTIKSHLRFVAIAQPVVLFGVFSASTFAASLFFLIWAFWRLATGQVAIYLALLSMLMSLFGVLFMGFSILFFQLRENIREMWMGYYPKPWPPSRRIPDNH